MADSKMKERLSSVEPLPGHDKLTWVDKLRSHLHSDMLQTNENTGAVENPKREFLRERIKVRQQEAAEEQRKAAEAMKRKLED